MPIVNRPPLLLPELSAALDAYDRGDFVPMMQMVPPGTERKALEVISFPGPVRPMTWEIKSEDLLFEPLPVGPGMCGRFADIMKAAEREVCAGLIGSMPPSEVFDAPPMGRSYISALAHLHFAKQQALADWQRFNAACQDPILEWLKRVASRSSWRDVHPAFGQGKNQRPKWGQPGRGRRRRARVEAREREAIRR